MERYKNMIIFNENEQTEFGVQGVVPVASALQTADTFLETADRLNSKTQEPADPNNAAQLIEWRRADARAPRLSSFASQIMQLCPDEVLAPLFQLNSKNKN